MGAEPPKLIRCCRCLGSEQIVWEFEGAILITLASKRIENDAFCDGGHFGLTRRRYAGLNVMASGNVCNRTTELGLTTLEWVVYLELIRHLMRCGRRTGWLAMLKKIAVTISATAFVMLAIALAPHVPTALATARHGIDDAKLNEPVAEQSCASFEVWFLDPACSQLHHVKKVARTKQRLAHKASK